MKRIRLLAAASIVVASLAIWLAAAGPALADGIVIPEPPPGPDPVPLREAWLTIRYHRVQVTIEDQIAVTRVEQEFVNEHDWEAEGTYVFPLPEGASVSEFTMWVDGRPVEGKILEADEARRIYEDVVRRRRDPALLEYVGRSAVRARIFPIPPGGSRQIELEYTQVLPVENGLVDYVYPLGTEKFSARPLEQCSVRVEVRSRQPIHALYSPTHQDRLFVERDGDHRATAAYEESDVLPDQDFRLVYTVAQEDVGLNLLTYPDSPEEGFFLLLAAPSLEVAEQQVVSRDVILVLDTSGSMEGEKLAQAKDALAYVLRHLNAEDRFGLIAFNSGIERFAAGLRPASEAAEAIAWSRGLEALGGTDINRALLEALTLCEGERPAVLIFLTDGLPTEGVTNIPDILVTVEAMASDAVRIFPFGVGDDVNTILLDSLAEYYRGATAYVRPGERIDEEVSALYAKIRTPVLTDLALDFGDVAVQDVYPRPLPDLFAGSQLIVAGRYRVPDDAGRTDVVLSGLVNGRRRTFVYPHAFRTDPWKDPAASSSCAFIPRLWATRKIGHLMTQIRLHGEEKEFVDAIIALSVRYGIITPYTSFLIEEDDILTVEGRERAAQEYMAMPTAPASGATAVEKAEEEADLRSADSAAPPSGGAGDSSPGRAGREVRHVGPKTFVRQDGAWLDTAYDPDELEAEAITFGSQIYFDLLARHPEWGAYLALGEHVLFVVEDDGDPAAYEILPAEGWSEPVLPTETPPPAVPTRDRGDDPPEPTPTPVDQVSTAAREGLCAGSLGVAAAALALPVLVMTRRRRHDS